MSAPTRYRSGEWLGMFGSGLWLLTTAVPEDEIVDRSWQLICGGAALHELVAMYIERTDLTYALAGTVGEITQVVVRGPVRVEIATPAGLMVMAGADDGGDWSGHVVPDPVLDVTLIGGAASHAVAAPAPGARPVPWLTPPPSVNGLPAPRVQAPVVDAPVPAAGLPVLVGEPTRAVTEASPPVPAAEPPGDATIPDGGNPRPAPPAPVVPEPAAPVQGYPAEPEPPPTAVRPAMNGLISDVSWADALVAPVDGPVGPPRPPMPGPRPPRPPMPSPAPPRPPMPGPTPRAEPLGNTASRQDLDVTIYRPIGQTSVMTGGALTVAAVRCVDGHLNPLTATSCRVCARAVPPQSPTIVPRPPLGTLRMSTSDTIRLDHGVVFGRDPGTPDASRRDQPYFVKLTDKDISRRHLEVVLDGWDVMVVDLNSSNGSAITMPGGVPEVIPGGTRKLLVPGTVVHLSDTISFVYEVTP